LADTEPTDAPQDAAPNAASLIASALLIAIVGSFAWYGWMGRFAKDWGWPWYAAWVLAILLPPFVYLAVRTGSARRAVAPFLFIVTIGLLLAIVFPVAIL
jgi:hypothetical protein